MINRLFCTGICIILLVTSYCFAQTPTVNSGGLNEGTGVSYFPPPESEGGWRKLEEPEEMNKKPTEFYC